MGLRYLFVGHTQPIVAGILTRKDLTEEHIKLSIGKKVRSKYNKTNARSRSSRSDEEELEDMSRH